MKILSTTGLWRHVKTCLYLIWVLSHVYLAQAAVVYTPNTPKAQSPGDIVGLQLQNDTSTALQPRMITFGQVFLKGQVQLTTNLKAVMTSGSTPVQMDVKTKYSDGSVRMAILTMLQPVIPAKTTVSVMLNSNGSAQGSPLDLNQTGSYSFTVDMTIGSTPVHVDVLQALRTSLSNGSASYWLKGPLATQARVTVPIMKAMRLVCDVTLYADGSTLTDAQFNNDIAMGSQGGALTYNVSILANGVPTTLSNLNHYQYGQWHQVFYSNGKPGVNIQRDVDYLIKTKTILPYNLALGLDSSQIVAPPANATKPFAINGLTQYMPTTGDREDIGPTTQRIAVWILSQNKSAWDYAMAQADAAAGIPWHMWDAAHGRWLNVDDYPQLWVDPRGGNGPPGGLTQQIGDTGGWAPDTAHQPALSYIPYIMSGSRFYLDQLNAQAAWDLMNTWAGGSRQNGKGLVIFNGDQVRAGAWSIRNINEAAFSNPDGSWEKTYFTKILNNNLNWVKSQIPDLTAEQGECHGYLWGDNRSPDGRLYIAPWQQDYLVSALSESARMGSSEALDVLKWMLNFQAGRFLNSASGFNPHDGAAYELAVSDLNQVFVKTWRAMQKEQDASGFSAGNTWGDGDYVTLAFESLALLADLTQDPQARAAYQLLATSGASAIDPSVMRGGYARFSMAPPQTGTGDTQSPTIPTNLIATPTSSSQINLHWNASTDNVGVSGYKVFRNGTPLGSIATTSYSDAGLAPSTSYSYAVSAVDAAGNESDRSPGVSASTLPGVSLPMVSLLVTDHVTNEKSQGPAIWQVTRTGSTNSNLIVTYGLTGSATNGVDYKKLSGSVTIPAGSLSANIVTHALADTLTEGKETIILTLKSSSQYTLGGVVQGTVIIYDNPILDTEAPSPPAQLTALVLSSTQIDLTWNESTDNVGIKGYKVYRDGSEVGTSATASYSDMGLAAARSYHYTVAAFDDAGNVSPSSNEVVGKTLALGALTSLWNDTVIPPNTATDDPNSVELGLKFHSIHNGKVLGIRFYKSPQNAGVHVGNLWSDSGTKLAGAVFTNESASGWQEVRFATPVNIISNVTYVASYLAPNGNYSYESNFFSNHDQIHGDLVAPSSETSGGNGVYHYGSTSTFPDQTWNANNYFVDVLFQAEINEVLSDTEKPSAPTHLTATPISSSQVSLKWDASTDNVGVTGYRVFRDGIKIKLVKTTSYTDTGLTASTLYTYSVRAIDAALNRSASSGNVSVTTPSDARVLKVGAGKTYSKSSQAAAVTKDGDIVEIDAGLYTGDVCTWTSNNLILRGVGSGKAHLDAGGKLAQGKAIWVISGSNTTVENIEFSGAQVVGATGSDANGAGIRQEGSGLTIRNCFFHDSQEGILAGDNPTSDIVIEHSEFARNGILGGDGHTHNIYVNHVRSFTMRFCYSHDVNLGHLVKSRALTNSILYNRLMDSVGSSYRTSYELDFPNGGRTYVIGNIIAQSSSTDNPSIIAFAEEGASNPQQELYVVNNSIVNNRTNGGTFVWVNGNPVKQIINNVFVGAGTAVSGSSPPAHNIQTSSPGFVDLSNQNYHLSAGSPAIDQGVDPGSANGFSLKPDFEYVDPAHHQTRTIHGSAIDLGAFEF